MSLSKIESGATVSAEGAVWVSCPAFEPAIRPGDRVRCRVTLSRPSPARNPGAFDYAEYTVTKGYHATGRIRSSVDFEVLERNTSVIQEAVTGLREHVRKTIRGNLSGPPAALLEGVLLGDKRQVPEIVRDQFSRAGVSHVLAVSGLHVGLVAAGVFFLVRALSGGHLACSVGTTTAVWVYAVMTGVPASVDYSGWRGE